MKFWNIAKWYLADLAIWGSIYVGSTQLFEEKGNAVLVAMMIVAIVYPPFNRVKREALNNLD